MPLLGDLKLRLRALFTPHRVEAELDEELAFHLEREKHQQIANGVGPDEALTSARARFGSLALAAEQCRDARATAVIDGWLRDIRFAIRTVVRSPLTALTIVATVAIGLGLIAVVFTFFNTIVFRVDEVRNPHELFEVERPRLPNGDAARFTRPEYEALRRETRVFTDVFAMLPDIDSRISGRMMGGTLVTGNFFDVLGVRARLGRALTPADDERYAPRPVVVLSHRGWSRWFESDPAVIGRTLIVNGLAYEIVGVMPEGFRGLNVAAPDYWAPLGLLGQVRRIHAGREDAIGIEVVGRLQPGVSRQAALAGLIVWDSGRFKSHDADRRTARLALAPRTGAIPRPLEAVAVFSPLFFVFGLILMIGCVNVANLLLARAVSRQREIGIRLSLGASRRQIVRQLLTEGLLLSLVSVVLAFVISRVAINATVYAVTSTLAPEIAEYVTFSPPGADWRVVVFLVGTAVLATLCFALLPALQATRVELVRAVRGEVTRDPRPGRARNVLIGIQVTASALLLICAGVFLRSAGAASKVERGLRTADTIAIDVVNEETRRAQVDAVTGHPRVAAVAASWPGTLGGPRQALAETAAAKASVGYKLVSDEYFQVLDIAVLRGRGFTQSEALGNAAVAVVSETTARELWADGHALGQTLGLDPDPNAPRQNDDPPLPARTFTVVGVTRDVPGFKLAEFKEPGVYLPTNAGVVKTRLTVRVHGDPEQARRELIERLTVIDPNLGDVITLRTVAKLESYVLHIAFWLTFVLGAIALALTLSGLFSVLSYLVEQRKKEISVRMALGATMRDIGRLVISQSVRPVGVGLLAGAALAAAVATALLATPAAAEIGSVVHVFDPVAYVASLTCVIAACAGAAIVPALHAARLQPARTLRDD